MILLMEVARVDPEMISSRPGRRYNLHYRFDDDHKEDHDDDDGIEYHDVDQNSDKESLIWFSQERKLRCCR